MVFFSQDPRMQDRAAHSVNTQWSPVDLQHFGCTYTVPAAVMVQGYRRNKTGKDLPWEAFIIVSGQLGVGTDSNHESHVEDGWDRSKIEKGRVTGAKAYREEVKVITSQILWEEVRFGQRTGCCGAVSELV